jgi:DNA-directed RNA polymerase subunit RPC12/RpoP
MTTELKCSGCGKIAAFIESGRLSKGMVVYCQPCADKLQPKREDTAVPDFLSGLFRYTK